MSTAEIRTPLQYGDLVAWCLNVRLTNKRSWVRLPIGSARYQVVITWMSDRLRTDKLTRYITNGQGQLSLPSLEDS